MTSALEHTRIHRPSQRLPKWGLAGMAAGLGVGLSLGVSNHDPLLGVVVGVVLALSLGQLFSH